MRLGIRKSAVALFVSTSTLQASYDGFAAYKEKEAKQDQAIFHRGADQAFSEHKKLLASIIWRKMHLLFASLKPADLKIHLRRHLRQLRQAPLAEASKIYKQISASSLANKDKKKLLYQSVIYMDTQQKVLDITLEKLAGFVGREDAGLKTRILHNSGCFAKHYDAAKAYLLLKSKSI